MCVCVCVSKVETVFYSVFCVSVVINYVNYLFNLVTANIYVFVTCQSALCNLSMIQTSWFVSKCWLFSSFKFLSKTFSIVNSCKTSLSDIFCGLLFLSEFCFRSYCHHQGTCVCVRVSVYVCPLTCMLLYILCYTASHTRYINIYVYIHNTRMLVEVGKTYKHVSRVGIMTGR